MFSDRAPACISMRDTSVSLLPEAAIDAIGELRDENGGQVKADRKKINRSYFSGGSAGFRYE